MVISSTLKRAAFLLTLLIPHLFPVASSAETAKGVDCSIAEDAIEVASKIRKLNVDHPVPCSLQGRAAVEKYLRDTLNKKIPEARLKYEGKVYELIGIVPPGYDYINSVIKLYTDQLGGYYDPELRAYVMAEWMPSAMQMPIAVHELTHALQDQRFNLEQLMDEEHQTSDAMLARSSLVEGDATAVMLDYQRSMQGQGSIAGEKSISGFLIQNISGAMLTSSISQAPPALQSMLIFPYVSGLNFVHRLLLSGDYAAVDKAFARLPNSSSEILHPDIYLSGRSAFTELPLPGAVKAKGKKGSAPLFDDRLGEFVVSSLLGSYIPPLDASAAASGWRGDRIALYSGEKAGEFKLLWNLRWSSEKTAQQFFRKLRTAYEKRFSAAAAGGEKQFNFDRTVVGAIRAEQKGVMVEISVLSRTPS